MEKERIQKRLSKILDIWPPLKDIFLSTIPIDFKRSKIKNLLSEMLAATFDENPEIPPLEWVLSRNAINILRNLVSIRSEKLSGFEFLQYIDDLLGMKNLKGMNIPDPGFFAELEHLLTGIVGNTGIYQAKAPSFNEYEGEKAARLRSTDLSRMAKTSHKFMNRYASGLDKDVFRRRSANKSRILKYFDSTELEWRNWKWHTRHIVRDADTLRSLVNLTDDEYRAVKLARENRVPFGITPYYLSLMDYESTRENDYGIRSQVIPPLSYLEKMEEHKKCADHSIDFMLERDTTPIEGITRRYPQIVILKPVLTCPQICVYCQRNWEIEDVYSPKSILPKEKLEKALKWLEERPEINEVLITGGDPLILSNEKLENLLAGLSRMKHIERIRIGTRTPVTLPQRLTDSLVKSINRFHSPGKREVIIITHFEHLYEITPEALEAVQKLRRYGLEVYNQLVYTFFNSRKFEAAALRHKLRLIGVTPYYTFNTKGKEETDDYRVPIARLLQEQKEEARLVPGTVRTDEIVFNVPGLGKNYLRASQHHDIISILPDGRRVYEFHPWEKKLFLADTYVHIDVSIYDYLKRLKSIGEDTADYRTIWYYY